MDSIVSGRYSGRGKFLPADTRPRCPEQSQSGVSEFDTVPADHDEFILVTGGVMALGRIATTIMLPSRQCGQICSEWSVSS